MTDRDAVRSAESSRLSQLGIPFLCIGVYDNGLPIVTVDMSTLMEIYHRSISGRFIAQESSGDTYSGVYTDADGVIQYDRCMTHCCAHRFVSGWGYGRQKQRSHYKGQYYHARHPDVE